MTARWAGVLQEPLLHFLIAGAALFALDHWRHRDAAAPSVAARGEPARTRAIVLDGVVRRRLAEGWQAQNGVAPTPAELERLTDEWVREEILYREGLARGLDRDDERVRARVAAKMGFVLDAQLVVPAPTDAELRAYFETHAERWARAARLDFTHVFVRSDAGTGTASDAAAKPRARAEELLTRLRKGADPNGLGDTFSGGRRYRGRQLDDLAAAFGPAFADGLDQQEPGAWALRTSRFGFHLVRVDRHASASAADFEAARLDVKHEWEAERRQRAFEEATAALRARWQVEVAP